MISHTYSNNTVSARRTVSMAVILGLVISLMGAFGVINAQSAEAYTGADFDPGSIISDSEFYKSDAMSEAQIQSFLDDRVGVCDSTLDRCLNVLVHTTDSRAEKISTTTGDLICAPFQGGERLAAATIIYRAQVACGISAKVILVTLQKEQGLVTESNPTSTQLNRAMGMACPDTDVCATYALGFGNQVYLGTRQLKTYKAANFARQPGTQTIKYHPNDSCGTSTFTVKNYATAALYNYTPYRPNTAALNNLGAYGDSCSSYGNRNFWDYYYTWFGNPNNITPSGITVARIGGADRYAVSVGVSRSKFNSAVPVVYIATGEVFSDALSAGAAAAHGGGPLLLVRYSTIPAAVRAEIVRLAPAEIVVAGGPGSVSETVYSELAGLAPTIRRESGIDRYEASRNIAAGSFGGGATIAYLATGKTFPDALSASAAAGSLGAPVILVRGTDATIDAATAQLLADLGVSDVRIAGGPASVSEGIKNSIATLPGVTSVVRFGGADRYVVSEAVNSNAFVSATTTTAYVASGSVFSDALSGGPVAGITSSPLYVVRSSCIPKTVLQNMIDLGITRMVILGGSATMSTKVQSFNNCT